MTPEQFKLLDLDAKLDAIHSELLWLRTKTSDVLARLAHMHGAHTEGDVEKSE